MAKKTKKSRIKKNIRRKRIAPEDDNIGLFFILVAEGLKMKYK